MKLVHDGKPSSFSYNGRTYLPDRNGVFDIPDQDFSPTIFQFGFYYAPEKPAPVKKQKEAVQPVDYPIAAEVISTKGNLE